VDEASAGCVDVGDEEEGDGDEEGQDDEDGAIEARAASAVSDEGIAADGDGDHETPGGGWDAVPPGGLGIALGVEDIVHAGNREGHDGGGLGQGGSLNGGPHLGLELGGLGVDCLEVGLIAGAVEVDAEVEVLSELGTNAGGVGGGEDAGTDVLGADGVGLGFLIVAALVVAADGHGEGEADDEAEEGEGAGLDKAEVVALVGGHGFVLAQLRADAGGKPEDEDGEWEEEKWVVEHGAPPWVRNQSKVLRSCADGGRLRVVGAWSAGEGVSSRHGYCGSASS